ncbi:hypothetical protein EVA_09583 [gut metagenome]|uniref:Uncharacterized protein n=1 Tax=gut metagenome TaxID=749906 RepID=J9GQH1_9ZZZZ
MAVLPVCVWLLQPSVAGMTRSSCRWFRRSAATLRLLRVVCRPRLVTLLRVSATTKTFTLVTPSVVRTGVLTRKSFVCS